jgi:hypothetical protein
MARPAPEIPAKIRQVERRFERWRNSHPGGKPLPTALWASAVEVAKEHGVVRTAQVLRLDYAKLKRLTALAGVGHHEPGPGGTPRAAFMELLAPATAGASECLIELEGPRGKVRIQWKGTGVPDLAALSRAIWEPA